MSIRHRSLGPKWTQIAETAREILIELHGYWPLTLRQVYYQLVARQIIPNNAKEYFKLSKILATARIMGLIEWEAIEDRARGIQNAPTYDSGREYADLVLNALNHYNRNKVQSQEKRIELWVEKDALSRICFRVASNYGIPVVTAKGFSSVSFVHDLAVRVKNSSVPTVVLYFGDLDPSGYAMLPTMTQTLHTEMDVPEDMFQGVRCALTLDQVRKFKLPHNPDALKQADPRAKAYVAQFGEMAVELDALTPAALEYIIKVSIEEVLDLSTYADELELEGRERLILQKFHKKCGNLIKGIRWPR